MNSAVHSKSLLLHRLSTHGDKIKAFGVKELGLFGSFKKDTNIHNDSDVDFLIEFEKGQKSYDNFMGVSTYLEELLGRKVELVTPQSLSKYIGPHILKEVEQVSL
ncbi:nucleotidyltransferase [Chitinophaga sp. SYP-B3965]|uniref:nucleotidyltransferase family protein n=1 Tax=Chitinophaga sp. SYP-B3965 TaxID=2663120 RepID=UPI001299861C|nr:nucleotidyltransferase family protein [Chitinophaga sp. SYP-B3965]MRG47079.1 nucleotidyltransferase [Chitinophaga sp. SYP-B3965]